MKMYYQKGYWDQFSSEKKLERAAKKSEKEFDEAINNIVQIQMCSFLQFQFMELSHLELFRIACVLDISYSRITGTNSEEIRNSYAKELALHLSGLK